MRRKIFRQLLRRQALVGDVSCVSRAFFVRLPAKAGTHNHYYSKQVGQVAPVGIIFFDQPYFSSRGANSSTASRARLLPAAIRTSMDEAVHTIFLDEFRAATAAVLLKPCPQVVGDADVERSVAAAGEDVDIICACCAWFGTTLQEL
jgi:hypothetical protein